MTTDPPPRTRATRDEFLKSDAQVHLALPDPQTLRIAATSLQNALTTDATSSVHLACAEICDALAHFYGVKVPKVSVLGIRPHRTSEGRLSYELYGDYTFESQRIRVWMRTAILGKVTSYRGLLNTLLHEFCHHLDVTKLGFANTPHTRGFYARIDDLYHLALDTPTTARKALAWKKRGNIWALDWSKMRPTKSP